jgi:hypothetical protein
MRDKAFVISTDAKALFNIAIPLFVSEVPFAKWAICTISVASLAPHRAVLSANIRQIRYKITLFDWAVFLLRIGEEIYKQHRTNVTAMVDVR